MLIPLAVTRPDSSKTFSDRINKLQAQRSGTSLIPASAEQAISRRHTMGGALPFQPKVNLSIKGAAEKSITTYRNRAKGRNGEEVSIDADADQVVAAGEFAKRQSSRIAIRKSAPPRPTNRELFRYPPSGKNSVLVHTEDLQRLDDGEFLNDVIIDLFIKYVCLIDR